MSIIQSIIGTNLTISGGGGTYPEPGSGSYSFNGGGGFSQVGTAYDPGGALDNVTSPQAGWWRIAVPGTWSNSGNNDNPSIFQSAVSGIVDTYGGFGFNQLSDNFAMEWKGYIRAYTTATYWNVRIESDDVARFWIGSAALDPDNNDSHAYSNNNTVLNNNSLLLTDGKWYPIRLRFQEWSGAEYCQVYFAAEGGTMLPVKTLSDAGHIVFNASTAGY